MDFLPSIKVGTYWYVPAGLKVINRNCSVSAHTSGMNQIHRNTATVWKTFKYTMYFIAFVKGFVKIYFHCGNETYYIGYRKLCWSLQLSHLPHSKAN